MLERGLSILGWAALVVFVAMGIRQGLFPIPGGDLVNYIIAGERFRAGAAVYDAHWNTPGLVPYAPPVIVLLGATFWLPGQVLAVLVGLAELLSLRYIAGSWWRVGVLGLLPLTAFDIASGYLNLVIGAIILASQRESAAPLAWAGFAKIGPVLALPFGRWREFAVSALVGFAITIPWLHMWPEWVHLLLSIGPSPGFPLVIPLVYRLPFALALLLVRRPWARAAAAVMAMPGFYIITTLLFLVPIRLYADEFLARRSARSVATA